MVDIVMSILGSVLYPLFSIIFVLIDVLQWMFNSLAGIGSLLVPSAGMDAMGGIVSNVNDGTVKGTGLIFYLLNTPLVKNLLMSITILALFLLILFTIMAFIKNVYTAKPKTWQEIIGNALKGLLSFVAIPVFCLLGVWVSNIVLQAINGATSTGGATQMSNKLFLCAAYNANWYRVDNENTDPGIAQRVLGWNDAGKGIEIPENATNEQLAAIVDQAFAQGTNMIYSLAPVLWGYNTAQINYLILVVGGIFMLYVLVSLAYAMVRRMFILITLFVISPAICAMYPLDDGSAVGQWRKQFISNTISAYGAVAGMNIFFSLLPIIQDISFLSSSMVATNDVDYIIELLIMICGLFVVKEIISMISGFIDGDDAYSKGTSLRSSSKNALKKYAGGAITTTTGAFARAKQAKADGQGRKGQIKAMFSGAGSSILSTVTGGTVDLKGIQKTWNEQKEGYRKKEEDDQKKQDRKKDLEDALNLVSGGSKISDLIDTMKGNNLRGMTNKEKTEEMNNILIQAKNSGASDAQLKALAESLAKTMNLNSNAGAGRKFWTEENVMEGYNKTEEKKVLNERFEAHQLGYKKASGEYQDAKNNMDGYSISSGLLQGRTLPAGKSMADFDDGNGNIRHDKLGLLKVNDAELESLRIRAKATDANGNFTADATAAQNELTLQSSIREFEGLKKTTEEFEEKVKKSAEGFADTMLALAEKESGQTKTTLAAAANEVKDEITKGGTDFAKIIKDAMQNAKVDATTQAKIKTNMGL